MARFWTGRGPGWGSPSVTGTLLDAYLQIAVIARASGIGGAQGRDLNIWEDGAEGHSYIVGPRELIGRGGIMAPSLHRALDLRAMAVEQGCWPQSQQLVVWHSREGRGAVKPIGKREATAILSAEAGIASGKAEGL